MPARPRDEHAVADLVRRAFGIRHPGDLHERASDLGLPLPLGAGRRGRLEAIRTRGVLFVHVPKNAGTSISTLLYGRKMRHETIRYYRHVARDLDIPSFAIWRDPVERFCSAFDFVRDGGGRNVRLDAGFARRYARLETIDDALDQLERQSSPYAMDYVFRPQSWFLCNKKGQFALDHLFSLNDLATLPHRFDALRGHTIPHLNESTRQPRDLTPRQRARIIDLYACDEKLIAHLE